MFRQLVEVGRKLQIRWCIIKAQGTRTIGETMKYAIISDIHANPAALERVLADAEQCGAEKVVCAGDVVGYGPDPVGAIRILRERGFPL